MTFQNELFFLVTWIVCVSQLDLSVSSGLFLMMNSNHCCKKLKGQYGCLGQIVLFIQQWKVSKSEYNSNRLFGTITEFFIQPTINDWTVYMCVCYYIHQYTVVLIRSYRQTNRDQLKFVVYVVRMLSMAIVEHKTNVIS